VELELLVVAVVYYSRHIKMEEMLMCMKQIYRKYWNLTNFLSWNGVMRVWLLESRERYQVLGE